MPPHHSMAASFFSCAAEGFKRVIGEFARAHVALDRAMAVVGGEAGEAHGTGFDAPHAGAVSVLFAHGAGDNGLEIHAHVLEEVLGQVAAMEADGLIRVV